MDLVVFFCLVTQTGIYPVQTEVWKCPRSHSPDLCPRTGQNFWSHGCTILIQTTRLGSGNLIGRARILLVGLVSQCPSLTRSRILRWVLRPCECRRWKRAKIHLKIHDKNPCRAPGGSSLPSVPGSSVFQVLVSSQFLWWLFNG